MDYTCAAMALDRIILIDHATGFQIIQDWLNAISKGRFSIEETHVIRKILIPVVDEYFVEAIEELVTALQQADDDLILRVMNAIEPADSVSVWIFKESYREANELLDAVSRRLRQRFPYQKIETAVVEGSAKEAILREAEDWSADLILLGPHSKRGIAKFLLGSVASSVIPDSPCNVVMLVKPEPVKSDSRTKTVKKQISI